MIPIFASLSGENVLPVNNSASFEIAIVATEKRLPVDSIDVSFCNVFTKRYV